MDPVSQIKQSLDITDVVGSYVSLKKSGKNYKGLCPFHSEDTPSFMVSPEIQIYKCFGCGEGGDMFSFVEKIEGVDFARALELLADKAGIKIEKGYYDPNKEKKIKIHEINNITAKFYNFLLTKHQIGKEGLNYLHEKRKIKDVIIKDFMLGYAPNRWSSLYDFLKKKGFADDDLLLSGVVIKKSSGEGFIDKFRGRIIFPLIAEDGKVVGFNGRDIVGKDPKYLNTAETLVFNKGSFLYGLNKSKLEVKKSGAILVEGPVDVINSCQHGITNVIASSGTALTTIQLKIIARYTQDIYFCFDSDAAGRSAIVRALDLTNSLNFNTHVISIPEPYKDLDEILTKDKKLALQVVKHPVPIYDFYLSDAFKKFDKTTAYGKKQIANFLMPIFSRIKDSVVADHYIKKLAEEIQIREESLRQTTSKNIQDRKEIPENVTGKEENNISERSTEEYLLALILKQDLDTMGLTVYKLEASDFQKDTNKDIFSKLVVYIDSKPDEFDIKYFTGSFSEDLKNYILDLYLWDFADTASSQVLFEREIEATILRIKKDTIKRELKNISAQIKMAELDNNSEKIKDLSERFSELSKKLN
ncbi:DNA primase [candidate division WWE3 bacterium RBG_19FT_COMBO_34_6]|uniref:DNA primase n=1 Tax=candidate division WWE3 bacterium RBG_19FT_COMBO_34_6 TaxID=1802612 RepID=A0A1F4UJV3_UNCKA|nr:MAG: DNA primase [candidate division WWE3 bacterium RBG_19FT_COMBO_34_6]